MSERYLCTLVMMSVLSVGPLLAQSEPSNLSREVQAVERAFAQTMADRDHEAFTSFLATEAVFFSGPNALRGKKAVAEAWRTFFEGAEAPFSWEPETVEVLESGTLALSTGPVRGPDGTVSSTFSSIWRREEDGVWRIVFDKGNPVCPAPPGSP